MSDIDELAAAIARTIKNWLAGTPEQVQVTNFPAAPSPASGTSRPQSATPAVVQISGWGNVSAGTVTITSSTAPVAVIQNSSLAYKSITIKASGSNTGIIYVGGLNVSVSNGYPLRAGESVEIPAASAAIFVVGSVVGDSCSWMVVY